MAFNQNGIGARDLPCVRYQLVKHLDGSSGKGHVVCTLDEVGFVGEWSCCIHRDAAGEVGLLWEREREEHRELPLHAMPPRANGGGSQSRDLRTRNDYSSTTRA